MDCNAQPSPNTRKIQNGAKIISALAAFLTLACTLTATLAPSPTVAQTRKDGDRLTHGELAQLDSAFQAYVNTGQLVGLITLVAHQGEIVDLRAFGKREQESHGRMTADTIFRIYSMSKPITSAAVMMLIERGQLKLKDPIAKYLPEFANPRVFVAQTPDGIVSIPAQNPITVEHLLTHTSGLTYGFAGDSAIHKLYRQAFPRDFNGSLAEFSSTLSTLPLIAQPGLRFNYSNGISLLGRIIEVVSGQPLDKFVKENIADPLGMYDTGFYVPKSKLYRFADNYRIDRTGTLRKADDNLTGRWSATLPKAALGGAGMVSTITDYYRFCQMILDKGTFEDVQILRSDTVSDMTKNHLPSDNPTIELSRSTKATGFGYGFAVIEDPEEEGVPGSPGELYWGGAATTLFWIDPKEDIVGILMTQRVPAEPLAGELRHKFKTIVYDALQK